MSIIARLEHDLGAFAGQVHGRLDELGPDVLDEIGRKIQDAHESFGDLAAGIKSWAVAHPEPIFALLRRVQPILFVKDLALVTRFDDCQEVLSRDDVFQVTYAEKFNAVTGGHNFFLGMQNTPDYTRDVSAMRLVVRREDIPTRILPIVDREARQIVAASGGRLDVVADLGRVVPVRLVKEYVGVSGPDENTMADWGAVISQYLFLAFQEDPAVTRAALAAAAGMRDVIDHAISDRKQRRSAERDDVLERCLRLQDAGVPGMDDLGIRNNLFGIVVGALPTTSAAVARAIDELLRRPEMLERAARAAGADDDRTVAAYVFEALRFNPIGPGVFRLAAEDYALARGHARSKTIPRGKVVVALLQSATFDGEQLDRPEEFRVDRPPHHYMHFGYGLHTCFGRYINAESIPHVAKAVLRCRGLERAEGAMGELTLDGPFPSALKVQFAV